MPRRVDLDAQAAVVRLRYYLDILLSGVRFVRVPLSDQDSQDEQAGGRQREDCRYGSRS